MGRVVKLSEIPRISRGSYRYDRDIDQALEAKPDEAIEVEIDDPNKFDSRYISLRSRIRDRKLDRQLKVINRQRRLFLVRLDSLLDLP
jgi:hypothetical protein